MTTPNSTSPSSGTAPKIKDGERGPQEEQIVEALKNGLTAARLASFSLKLGRRPRPNERPEYEAFLQGFYAGLKAISLFVKADEKQEKELFEIAAQLAKELYPDFDPLPPPTKIPKKGMTQ